MKHVIIIEELRASRPDWTPEQFVAYVKQCRAEGINVLIKTPVPVTEQDIMRAFEDSSSTVDAE